MPDLITDFHTEMLRIPRRAASYADYRPTRFLNLVSELGGLRAAKILLAGPYPASGLLALWERGCIHLSLEALVLQEPWYRLFNSRELSIARRRLEALDCTPEEKLTERE
ncbi:MAG: hypothetical protein Q8P12_02275 [bacterium]|nr:hypothetical protein [bacterium]